MSMKRTVGMLVVVLTLLTVAPQVNADQVVAMYGENAFAFHLTISHGAIALARDRHGIVVKAPFSKFWEVQVGIRLQDRIVPGGVDAVSVIVIARHIAGVPGHMDEGANPVNSIFGMGVAPPGGYALGGGNVFRAAPVPNPHPPIDGHRDEFVAVLTVVTPLLGEFAGRDIESFTLDITGSHCFGNLCPAIPDANTPVPEVPEPASLLLLGTNLIGFLGYRWRRRRLRKSATEEKSG